MFASKWITGFKKDKKIRARRSDVMSEQVKKILQGSDQKLILMVRG